MLLIFSLCNFCWFGYRVSWHVSPWVYLVQDSLYFLGLSECLLSHVRLVLHDLINAALSLVILPRRFPSPLSQLKPSLQLLMPTGRLFWCWDDNSNYSICSLFPPTPLSKPGVVLTPPSLHIHSLVPFTCLVQSLEACGFFLITSLSSLSSTTPGQATVCSGLFQQPFQMVLQGGLTSCSSESTKCCPSGCPCSHCSFLPLPLANSYPSFRFPISSSQTTKPDLGPLATCFL